MSGSAQPITTLPLSPAPDLSALSPAPQPAAKTPFNQTSGFKKLKLATQALQGLGATMAAGAGNMRPFQEMEQEQQQQFENRRQTAADARAQQAQTMQQQELQARMAEEKAQQGQAEANTARVTKETQNMRSPEDVAAANLKDYQSRKEIDQRMAPPKEVSDATGAMYEVTPSGIATPIHTAVATNPKTLTPPPVIGDLFSSTKTPDITLNTPLIGKPPGGQAEADYYQYLRDNKLPDTAANKFAFEQKQAAAKQPPQRPPQALGVDLTGRVVTLRSGGTVPQGTKTLTQSGAADIANQKNADEVSGALNYANNYMQKGQFTGAGDEGLLEQYFSLAKPSTGFRMTQPQIEMLQHARDAVQGAKAALKHYLTPEAPYFDDLQRIQIVQTMNELAQAKRQAAGSKGGGGGAPAPLVPRGKNYDTSGMSPAAAAFMKKKGLTNGTSQ